eukprot:TRINITY_DN1577_c0_g1_i2.p1 TRINITY_DN1577_c0_g1~~TRINITY_DN1577_c0_g1_i2.p1  ORF type:complete len:538 (+),score=103.89 TRINITY_DN1577_c0_g1_i2:45-1658(+)
MSDKKFITFGEAMLRFAPLSEEDIDSSHVPSGKANVLRTIGGDELNVAIALSKLGRVSEWFSVLPTGALGDHVVKNSEWNKVQINNVIRVDNADIGIFTVMPKEKTVHYQRGYSAWALQSKDCFKWNSIFGAYEEKDSVSSSAKHLWMHVTGISPMTGEKPAYNWSKGIEEAVKRGVSISMDFNHRKQLGTLEKLWDITKPHLKHLDILILSLVSLVELSQLHQLEVPPSGTGEEDPAWPKLLQQLQHKIGVNRLACCFKIRYPSGLQKRWSVIADNEGVHSTIDTPVYHTPKDECGGGSAWAAGYIDTRHFKSSKDPKEALRNADLLASLCQESFGDHSVVERSEYEAWIAASKGKPIVIDPKSENLALETLKKQSNNDLLLETLKKVKEAKVIPILRAKNPDIAIKRGIELVDLGCKILEVTLDTTDAIRVITELVKAIPKDKCVIGIGTVMDIKQLEGVVNTGVKFALSPINPKGFVEECHKHGILAIPAAFSPQELWETRVQGAHAVKLFPAQLTTPETLKVTNLVTRNFHLC